MGQKVNGVSPPSHWIATETFHEVSVADPVGLEKVFMHFGLSLSVLRTLCSLATDSVGK